MRRVLRTPPRPHRAVRVHVFLNLLLDVDVGYRSVDSEHPVTDIGQYDHDRVRVQAQGLGIRRWINVKFKDGKVS